MINLTKRPAFIASMLGDSLPSISEHAAWQTEMNLRSAAYDVQEMLNSTPRETHTFKVGDYPRHNWKF